MNIEKLLLCFLMMAGSEIQDVYAMQGRSFSAADPSTLTHAKSDEKESAKDIRREAQLLTSYGMNPHLRSYDLSVKVSGNKAVLNGKVESAVEKELAEQIALGVGDIQHVDNRIVVEENYYPSKRAGKERSFNEKVEDATITATVKSKLLWNARTDGLDINVDTLSGKVTLTGNVSSAAEKELAGQIARNTSGVVNLTNNLVINPDSTRPASKNGEPKNDKGNTTQAEVSDAWITAKVKSTLLYSSNVGGLDIKVTTNNGVVSLAGVVNSAAERDLAVELAKNIRGVKKVDASGLKTAA